MTNMLRRKQTRDLPLSAAWKHLLMTGQHATTRLPGWVEMSMDDYVRTAEGDYDYAARGDRLWAVHGADLAREAAANTFAPYWAAKQTPAGAGYEQWLKMFLAEHRY